MGSTSKTSRAFDTFDILGTRKTKKAEEEAKKTQAEQKEAIAQQKILESAKLAEEEDLLGRKKLQSKNTGRSLLTATSPTGVNTNLGGTA